MRNPIADRASYAAIAILAQRLRLFLVFVEQSERLCLFRFWYFLTLTLTSLLMGMSFAHTLEMPAKMNVERSSLACYKTHL